MSIFGEYVVDISFHGEAACAVGVVPCEVHSGEFSARPVGGNFVGFLEGGQEVVGMSAVAVFDAEIINNEYKKNWAPLVAPQSWGGGALEVSVFVQPLREEVVGKFSRLFEAIDTFCNFEVDPIIVCIRGEVVFVDEVLRYVVKLDADILWAVKWCAEVKVADVKACKSGLRAGEHTVNG